MSKKAQGRNDDRVCYIGCSGPDRHPARYIVRTNGDDDVVVVEFLACDQHLNQIVQDRTRIILPTIERLGW